MLDIIEAELPSNALTQEYKQQECLTDCYYLDVEMNVLLTNYLGAFYTSPLFKIERAIISAVTFKYTTDRDALALAQGDADFYSMWVTEERRDNQILMREMTGRTRSWLMVCPIVNGEKKMTRLFFGSVVMPKKQLESGAKQFGRLFYMLDGFHRAYSRALLKSAYNKLLKNN